MLDKSKEIQANICFIPNLKGEKNRKFNIENIPPCYRLMGIVLSHSLSQIAASKRKSGTTISKSGHKITVKPVKAESQGTRKFFILVRFLPYQVFMAFFSSWP